MPTIVPARSKCSRLVEAWHLGGLSAEQRAPVVETRGGHAPHDLLGHVRREPPRREIVEKEQRPGALHEDVVDAVVHEVDADGVVAPQLGGDEDLRADPIGRGHERLRWVARQREEAAEAAQRPELARVSPARGERTIALDRRVPRRNIDAGTRVGICLCARAQGRFVLSNNPARFVSHS